MKMTQEILTWIENHHQEQLELLTTLAQIPAPSGKEEKRVEFCRNWFLENGIQHVFVDEVLNVICPFGVTDSNPIVMIAAHSDVVFPDTDPLPLRIEDGKIHCPGIGDDTTSVVTLMTMQPTSSGSLPSGTILRMQL